MAVDVPLQPTPLADHVKAFAAQVAAGVGVEQVTAPLAAKIPMLHLMGYVPVFPLVELRD